MSIKAKSNILDPWMQPNTRSYLNTSSGQILVQSNQFNTDWMVISNTAPVVGGEWAGKTLSSIWQPAVWWSRDQLVRSDLQNGVTTASIFCDARSHHGLILTSNCHRPGGFGDHWMYHRHFVHAQTCPLGSLLGLRHFGRQWSLSCLWAG